tara:strand:- start:1178 stop:1345 length:168 start_codon:yes stop_codon:yes gene_type:complete
MRLDEIIKSFLIQAQRQDLKTAHFPKYFGDFSLKFSFGQGVPARVPWIAIHTLEI